MANKSLAAAQKAYKKGKAARESAAKKGVVTAQRPQKKKKKKEEERPQQSKPQQSRPQQARPGRQAPSKPVQKPQMQRPQKKAPMQSATKTNLASRYAEFKKSSFTPTVTNTSQKSTISTTSNTRYTPGSKVATVIPKDTTRKKPKSNLEDAKQAYLKGRNKTYLGTEEKETTTKLLSDKKQKELYKERVKEAKKRTYNSQNWAETKAELKRQNNKGWVDYLTKEYGVSKERAKEWLKTEEGTKARKETYMASKKATVEEINKGLKDEIKRGIDKTYNLKSVNALKKSDFNKMMTAQSMGREQGNKYLKSVGGDALLEKIGSKNAKSAYKGKFITGAMQGSGFANVIAGSVGTNNAAAKEAIRQTTHSKSYIGGYIAGQVGGFAMNKTSAAGRAIAKGVGKTGTQQAGKSIGKQFMKNRAGEMVAESGMNALDAIKLATDENGKINKKQAAAFMALNTGLTGAMGGALEGAGMKKASSNVKKLTELTELMGKQKAGKITPKELEQLNKVRDKLRKTAKNSQSLSGDISAKGLEDIKSSVSEARIQRAKAKSEARQARVDAEFAQAKTARKNARLEAIGKQQEARAAAERKGNYAEDIYARTNSPTKNMTEISAERAKVQRAQRDINSINAAEAEAKNLPSSNEISNKLKDANNRLDELKAMKSNPKVAGATKTIDDSIAKVEKEIDELKRQDSVVWRADRQKSRKQNLQATIDTANKRIEELSETSQTAKTVETKAEPKVIERTDLDRDIERAETTLKKVSDPDEAIELEQRIENLKAKRDGRTPQDVNVRKRFEETQRALTEVDGRLADAESALYGARVHAKNSKNAHGAVSPETQAKLAEAERVYGEIKAERDAVAKEASDAAKEMNFAQAEGVFADEVGLTVEQEAKKAEEAGEALSKDEKDAMTIKVMKEDLAQLDDQIALTQKRLAEATGDSAGAIRKELDALRQQRMVVESAIENSPSRQALMQASDELGKAITKQKSGVGKLIAKFNRGFVDSFGDWESVFRSFDDAELRSKAFARLQKLRMSRSEAASKVFDEFLDMYERFDLVGRKNKGKLADFEKYTFLQHELERAMDDTGFTGMTPAEVSAEIKNLEKTYGEDIKQFQQRVVKYFDELLDRDVASGFDTAEHVKELREKYHNYVPTFRDVDGVDAISRAKPYEEINFHRVHAAVGGDTWDVLPLHKQAMQKTQATLIRQNENELVSFVAEVAQVNRKDLISGKTPKEYLESTTMTIKDPKTGKYSVAYFVDGKKKSLQISEGMYKGIRQWTGEDRAFFMNSKLINTVSGKINRWFKDWITDYSLIFGARNFIRDIETGLFYSSNPIRYAKNIPRAVSCVLSDTKAGKALLNSPNLPEGFRNYLAEGQALTQAYKKNGGRMAQLVSESDPYVMLKRLHRKNGPLGVIREINSTIETIPRMAEFASTAEEAALKRSGMSRGEWLKLPHNKRISYLNEAVADADTLAKAMNRSKEVTLNFDRSGYVGRWLNSTFVPFFNPAIQGADKLTRVLVRDNHTAAEWAKMVVMFGVIGQGTEVLLNTVYANNESYKRLSDYEKTGYYHIPAELFGGDKYNFIKIPRAREVAAVQGPLDWYFQHVKYHCDGKDENLFGSFKSNAKMWYEQIGPVNPISDNVFYAPIRITKNKTWYGGYIENFDDQEKVKAGKSDEVWDENTTSVARAINKMMISAPDKLKFLGISDAQIKNMKSNVWSPKKVDDLLDSYLGVIYDMGLKNTSMKNPALTESVDKLKEGKFLGGSKGLADMFGSSFATAFVVDSVMSNAYRSNQYTKKADLQKQLDLMTKGLEEGSDEYNKVVQSKEYKKVNAQMRRLNQSFAYTSANYDNMMSNIYLRDDLTTEQKNFWAKKVKTEQNKLLYGRQQGDDVANADPMKWGYNVKRKDGSRLFSNDQLVDLCSFTYKDGNNAYKDSWSKYKELNPKDKSGKSWFEVTLGQREVNRYTGEPLSMMQYNVGAYVIESQKRKTGKTYEKVTESMEPFDNDTLKNEIKRAGNYYDYGGNLGEYKQSHKAVVQGGIDLNLSTYGKKGKGMESWDIMNAIARGRTEKGKRFNDRAYYAEGKYVSQRMNAARCLASDKYKKLGVDTESVNSFCVKHDFSYKGGGKETYPKPDEVEAAIRKDYKGKPAEVMAAVFEEICGTWVDNPFGKIGDYSQPDDTGITDLDKYGWGHRRRRGHRRHGWGGWGHGGGGGGSAPAAPKYSKYADINSNLNFKVSDFTKKSNVNEAYRKKAQKLRTQTRKKPKS